MPAGSIGYFSRQLKVKRRNRSIFVCRKASGKIFSQRPDNVGWKPKVYGQGKGPWMDFDNYFKRFESLNNDTISALLRGTGKYQDADIWLRLATYVSSLIARNPDTELTLLKTEYGENPNISVGYPVDMQRIAGAIYRTRWLIATCREDELILPDRGFFFIYYQPWKALAVCIPLRRQSMVIIGGESRSRKKISWVDNRWLMSLEKGQLSKDEVEQFNAFAMATAREECYASEKQVLHDAMRKSTLVKGNESFREYSDTLLYKSLGAEFRNLHEDEMLLWQCYGGLRRPDSSSDNTIIYC